MSDNSRVEQDEPSAGEAKTARSAGPKAPRIGPRETRELFTAMFTLMAHMKGFDVPPALLAYSLAKVTSLLGEAGLLAPGERWLSEARSE